MRCRALPALLLGLHACGALASPRLVTSLRPLPAAPGPDLVPVAVHLQWAQRLEKLPAPEALVVTLRLNGEDVGDRFMLRDARLGLLMRLDDYRALTSSPPAAATIEVAGVPHVMLAALPGAQLSFDAASVSLDLTLPAQSFPEQRLSLARPRPTPTPPAASSALLNYRAGAVGDADGSTAWSLATEAAVNLGSWLLRDQQQWRLDDRDRLDASRFITQAVHDDRARLQRLTLGDTVTRGDALGSSVQLAGVGFEKSYALDPYFVRQPALGFAGTVTLPSQVELYVGGNRVLQQQLAPGPFRLADFSYYGGARDVRVVLRDALGREQVYAYPYFFTDQALAPGLHDYGYHLGVLRRPFGAGGGDYGALGWSAFHQYGFTEHLTAGLRAEGTRASGNGGPTLVWRSDRLGVLAMGAAGSWGAAGTGRALALAHSYQSGNWSSHVSLRDFGDRYAELASSAGVVLPRQALDAVLGYAPRRLGSLSLAYDWSGGAGERRERRGLTLSWSRALSGGVNLIVNLRRGLGRDDDDGGFAGVQYLPGRDRSAGAFWQRDASSDRQSLHYGTTVASGQGLDWRVALQRQHGDAGALYSVSPELQYRAAHATVFAEAHGYAGEADGSAYALSVAGSLASVDGITAFGRPIEDSFALVDLVPPLAGVRVYQSSQEAGRTDARGRLLLTEVGSFLENYVAIEDRDVPIEYSVVRNEQRLLPAYRSGSHLRFHLSRLQAVGGRLLAAGAAPLPLPLEFVSATLHTADGTLAFVTGRGGEFYIENLPPGRYGGTAPTVDGECAFTLAVPTTTDSYLQLPAAVICHAP